MARSRQKGKKSEQALLKPGETLERYELTYLEGVSEFALKELRAYEGVKILSVTEDAIDFGFARNPNVFKNLRRAIALYKLRFYPIPRPKALLGNAEFKQLFADIQKVQALNPQNRFTSFRFGAAGSDSRIFQRLAERISQETGLVHDAEEGHLLLRFRPANHGWEVLIRLTPRPLSTRDYRVCNLPGGLNASLAVVMNDMARVSTKDAYLNAMCGSGTLLIEQALSQPVAKLVGLDLDEQALGCARENISAAKLSQSIDLMKADARAMPFAPDSFTVITADLPWGDAVGSHQENALLYPAFLQETARIAASAARLLVLTHEIKRFEAVLAAQQDWQLKTVLRVSHSGHHPRLYALQKAM